MLFSDDESNPVARKDSHRLDGAVLHAMIASTLGWVRVPDGGRGQCVVHSTHVCLLLDSTTRGVVPRAAAPGRLQEQAPRPADTAGAGSAGLNGWEALSPSRRRRCHR